MNYGWWIATKSGALFIRLDEDAVVIVDVLNKKTEKTPKRVIDSCQRRLRDYEESE